MKLFKIYFIIFKKELKESFSNIQVILPVFILPSILLIILPVITFFSILYYPSEIAKTGQLIGDNMVIESFNNVLNNVFSLYFIVVPVSLVSVFGSSSFIAEKEGQTIESLFYTPVTIRQLFIAKILTVFSIVFIIITIFFIPFCIIVKFFGFKIFGEFNFPNLRWILLIFWLIPSLIFLTVSFVVWISSRAKSFIAVQQLVGLLILPIIFLFSVFNNIFQKDYHFLFLGLILWLFSFIFLKFQMSIIKYEKFLK